jgi:glutaredoxin
MYTSGEYTNTITSPYSQYSNLQQYHEKTSFGPKFPLTTPSQKYQAILDQPKLASYDVLTLNNTEVQYPLEKNAYNTAPPRYYIGEAPSNKFVRPFVPDIQFTDSLPNAPSQSCGVRNQSIVEGFTPTLSPVLMNIIKKSKELSVHIFILPSNKCSFSKKLLDDMVTQFGEEFYKYFIIKNIEDPDSLDLFTTVGGYAVPYFYSPKTNNSQTGYNGNIEKIINSLLPNKSTLQENYISSFAPTSLAKKIKDLQIIIYTMKNCTFCTMLKKMLEKEGLLNEVVIHDVSMLKDKSKLKGIRGFPHLESMKTKKSYTGCPMTLEMMVEKLS